MKERPKENKTDAGKKDRLTFRECADHMFARDQLMTIPNLMSVFRLLLIPVMVRLIDLGMYRWVLAVMIISWTTDILDGVVARRFDQMSDFGKFLDPLADKLTQLFLLIALARIHPVLYYLMALLVIKEFTQLYFGYMQLSRTGGAMSSEWYGKLSTVALSVSMAIIVLMPGLGTGAVIAIVIVCSALLLLSLVLYTRRFIISGRTGKLPHY